VKRRENWLRAARRQNPEWVPLDFCFSPPAMKMVAEHLGEGADFGEHFKLDGRWLGPTEGARRSVPDWRTLYYADGSLPDDATIDPDWGIGWVYLPETDSPRQWHPLRNVATVEDFEAYPWPERLAAASRFGGTAELVRKAHEDDQPSLVGGGVDFWFTIDALCGFERLLTSMAADEPWARKAFRRISEDMVRVAENTALTGCDVMLTGSDIAGQQGPLISPAMWRHWLLPMMRDTFAAAKAVRPDLLISYHSDGNVESFVEDFVELGVDILNPCQPECMDIFALKERYGDRLAFHGGIGLQSWFPFGTPQQVRDAVRRTIDHMAANGGGYICSPAQPIRPEVPWENIIAMVETVREYGHP